MWWGVVWLPAHIAVAQFRNPCRVPLKHSVLFPAIMPTQKASVLPPLPFSLQVDCRHPLQVFSWGGGERGQLGFVPDEESMTVSIPHALFQRL